MIVSQDHRTAPGPPRQLTTEPGTGWVSALGNTYTRSPTGEREKLILWELDAGMTEKKLASVVGVPRQRPQKRREYVPEA